MASSSDDDYLNSLVQEKAAPQSDDAAADAYLHQMVANAPAAMPVQPPADYQSQSALKNFSVGALQGAASVGKTALNALDVPAQFLENKFGTLGGPSVAQARANRDLENWYYQQNYGGSPAALTGNIVGSTALTAPVIAASGGALAGTPLAQGMNLLRNSGIVGRAVAGGLSGGTQGAAAAGMTSGGYNQPAGDQIKSGAELGGVLGAASPLAQKGVGAAYRTLTGAQSVSPATADLANKAINDYGILLRGSQITSSPFVRFLDSALGKTPLSGMSKSNEEILQSFNKAIGNTIEAGSDSLKPDVVSNAKKAIGAKFDQVANGVSNIADTGLGQDLLQIRRTLPLVTTADKAAPVENNINNILDVIANNQGTLSGKLYRTLTQHGSTLDTLMDSKDPAVSQYAEKIRNALDDALTRNAPQNLQDLLSEAKYQWKNYVTLKPLIEKADADGHISPALLLNRVRQVWGDVDTGGGGDLAALAKIGQQFLKAPPESGTAPRHQINRLLETLGGAGAGALGVENPHMVAPLLAAGAGTVAAGRAASAALRSDWYRNMLLNQAAQSPAAPSLLGAIGNNVAIPLAVSGQQTMFSLPNSLVTNAR